MSHNETHTKRAAVVLGGGLKKVQIEDQTRYEPEEQAKARLDKAYALFEEGQVDCIITTGKYSIAASADPDVTGPQTEAEVGKDYLLAKPGGQRLENRIFYEAQSLDTIGNAWFVKKECLEPLGITSCIVVTSDYHIKRTQVVFDWVLGPAYTIAYAEAPSQLSGEERARRDYFEEMLTQHVKTRMVSAIPAGDDEKLRAFMEGEHQTMLSRIGPGGPKPGMGPGFPMPGMGPDFAKPM